MVSTIAAVWSQLTSTGPPPPPHTDDIIYNLAAVILQQLLLFGGLFVAVVIAFHANTRDIGLPAKRSTVSSKTSRSGSSPASPRSDPCTSFKPSSLT